MSDVFVSYKAEDRRRVAPLVEALQADGLSVWWDAQIGGGDAWRESIEEQLESARCVIVIWSKRSIGREGRFVRDEASRAQRRGKYLPILIDKVEPPLGFGETQALSLVGWKGNPSDVRYQRALEAARSILEGKPFEGAYSEVPSGVGRRAVMIGGAAAAGIAAAGAWVLLKPGAAAAADSIAVLPFANLSGDPAQSYFSDGIAEELRNALARIAGLKVIGRMSSEAVRDADLASAARELKVAHILVGSVRRSPATIRVAAQLVEGRSGVERWSQAYDRPPGDILKIQSEIAESVAQALSLELGRAALTSGGTKSAAAYDLYLKGIAIREAAGPNEANYGEAIRLFDAAIERDPNFADAYAQKAQSLTELTGMFSTTAAGFDRGYNEAATIARRAIALAPERARGHSALAAALVGKLDHAGALREYKEALERFSGEVEVLTSYAAFMGKMGNTEEALKAAQQAISIDPLNGRPYAMRGSALWYARRYAEAAASYRHIIGLRRGRPAVAFSALGSSLMLLGRVDEGRKALTGAPADNVYRMTGEAILEARVGNRAESDRKLARLREEHGDSAIYQQAQVYAQQGETDLAFAALQRSWEVRDPGLTGMLRDPFLDPIRSDPRFAALERKLRLPDAA